MQNSKTTDTLALELIHSHSLDRVVGGCGGYRARDPYAGGAPRSMTDGSQSPSSGEASYQPGSEQTGSASTDSGGGYPQTTATGLMSLIQPLESLVQAIQAVERSLNSGSTTT